MTPAIERLELVYQFDQECVDNVKLVTGTHGETQGPQGTFSSVVIEDERRLLKSLREIKVLLDRFSPGSSARFNIKSILTMVVENTFSEMRTQKKVQSESSSGRVRHGRLKTPFGRKKTRFGRRKKVSGHCLRRI